MRAVLDRLAGWEALNFLLTNRLPRRLATTAVGRLAKVEWPPVAWPVMAVWRLFCAVDLQDADRARYPSMHACFTRTLRPGARPADPDPAVLASPCDAIVGACGPVTDGDQVHQVKGAPYRLAELLGSAADAVPYAEGGFVTLRLTAGMYHRFHAPHDLAVEGVAYLAGDCWNVNPPALKRVARLFCRNERAALHCRLGDGAPLAIVAVAAVLVASIRLSFTDAAAFRAAGPRCWPCRAALAKGQEMGWFEQGSTLVLLLPPGCRLAVAPGARVRAGERLAVRS